MTEQQVESATAAGNGWQPIDTAPMDGTRVRLGHEQDRSSMRVDGVFKTYGSFNGRTWDLSAFFTIPGGRCGLMSSNPTHWMPPPIPVSDGRASV